MLALVNLLLVSETFGTQAAASGVTARAKQLLERIASDRPINMMLVKCLRKKATACVAQPWLIGLLNAVAFVVQIVSHSSRVQ